LLNRAVRGLVSVTLVVLSLSIALPTSGIAAAAAPVLTQVLRFLAVELAIYGGSKVADRALGLDYQSQLDQVRQELEGQIRQAQGAEREFLHQELQLVRSQLEVLEKLLGETVSRSEVEALRRQVSRDFATFGEILSSHERRVGRLEADQERLRAKIDLVVQRLDLRTLQSLVTVHVGEVSLGSSSIPDSVASTGREVLLEALSQDSRVLLSTSPGAPFDVQVEGKILRVSTDQSTFSGFNTRPRPAVKTTVEVSLRLVSSDGRQTFLAKRYRREEKKMLSAGSDAYAHSENLAHDLAAEAFQEGVREVLGFLLLEDL
jgi:hypothetical protein